MGLWCFLDLPGAELFETPAVSWGPKIRGGVCFDEDYHELLIGANPGCDILGGVLNVPVLAQTIFLGCGLIN